MGWSIGFDEHWQRDIGYGVIAYCDHPECNETIDRGLAYVCAAQEPRGGDGCGLYFCEEHHSFYIGDPDSEKEEIVHGACERCARAEDPYTPKPEHPHWAWWKMNAGSWSKWREELSPEERDEWERMATQYKPTADDIEEAREDE